MRDRAHGPLRNSAWPEVSSDEPFRFAEANGDGAVRIQVQHGIVCQATTQLLAVTCLKMQRRRCGGAGTGPTGRTLHNEGKPRLNTATAARVTAAVSHRREETPVTGAITRGQRGRTGVSSSARARARTVSREYSGSVRASRRSRAITETRRNSSTWTGEAFSHAARAADSRASSGPRHSRRASRQPVRRSRHGPALPWRSWTQPSRAMRR